MGADFPVTTSVRNPREVARTASEGPDTHGCGSYLADTAPASARSLTLSTDRSSRINVTAPRNRRVLSGIAIIGSMTNDSLADELSSINNQLTSAHVALGNIYRQYGVVEGGTLVIDANDTQAYAAIEGVRAANAQLNRFLQQLPSYD